MRSAIPTTVCLALTLRYYATGDSYKSLEYLSTVSASTISVKIPLVSDAIYTVLQPGFMKIPNISDEWENIAKEFDKRWHFPNVLGSLDGKHIRIKNPSNGGSYYINYKGFYSIVLLALVDANYNFLYIDVGCNGRISDGGVYKNSDLYEALKNGSLNVPHSRILPGGISELPYVIIADEAFQLEENVMKPFPRCRRLLPKEQVFNRRLSHARWVVEMAFGILTNQFRLFLRPIELQTKNIDKVVKACCCLHNFLNKKGSLNRSDDLDDDADTLPGYQNQMHINASSNIASNIRLEFADYFFNTDQQSFQWNNIY